MERKTWATPQLIALVRGTVEEAVLRLCKAGQSGSGPETAFGSCYEFSIDECIDCSVLVSS